MNQILNKFENIEQSISSKSNPSILKQFSFKFVFIISVLIIISCIIYFIHSKFIENKNQELSKQMLNNFNITTLYSNSSEYQTANTVNNMFVIGIIEISTLDLHYPILFEITDENLKIAPCKFYGPMPNKVGNLCIAAHNYRNQIFFSRLNELTLNDIINIYDSNGSKISYYIYDKYVTDSSYLECTNQDTNGEKEITLVTCNKPDNSKRIIIKAKEKK